MNTHLLKVFAILFGIAKCLLFYHFFVFFLIFFVELKDLHIGRRILIYILMYKVHYSLQDVTHVSLAAPVLCFNQRQEDFASFIYMYVFEIWFKFDKRSQLRVLSWKRYFYRILPSIPDCSFFTWNPKNPQIVSLDSFRCTLYDLSPGQISDLIEFVLDSGLSQIVIVQLRHIHCLKSLV